jgi:hypothetical protein
MKAREYPFSQGYLSPAGLAQKLDFLIQDSLPYNANLFAANYANFHEFIIRLREFVKFAAKKTLSNRNLIQMYGREIQEIVEIHLSTSDKSQSMVCCGWYHKSKH